MDDLFGNEPAPETAVAHAPLAERMRPRNLDEYAGQEHILGPGKLLRRAIEGDRFSSIVLYGPPGTGKTSLAGVIARLTRARFERLSGVESNVADLRKTMAAAATRLARDGTRTILFIDEIHRFNKAQQDVLLPDVERGTVRLIGATTMNPFFYVNSPLVSRSMVFELRPLSAADLRVLMDRALADEERGLGAARIRTEEEAAEHLAEVCDGDARRCLNALELASLTTPPENDGSIVLTRAIIEDCIQRKAVVYDAHDDALDEKEDEKEDDEHVALTPTTARVLSLGPRIAEANSTGGGAVASVADTFLATALPEMGSFAGAARKAAEKRQPGRTGAHDGCVLTPGLWYVHELEMVEARSSATAACKCSPRRPLLPTQVRARARDGRSLRRVRRPTLEPAERGGVLGCVHAAPGAATR